MKNYTALFTLLVMFSSCDTDIILSDTTYEIAIVNNSGYDIDIRLVGEIIIIGSIKNNEKMEFYSSYSNNDADTIPELPPPLDFKKADSIRITYDGKVVIWHTKDTNSPVTKSLMLKSSYEGGKVSNSENYEHTYTFTPADYEEALNFGG